ncbi:oxidoreductase-like domain-containing protein 1 [Lingula anatina]|uniref:Oxidoreductase-like domain-containing protein 1 n=1 Tax=Lingula anatina TaxID=7574 RepID=A0A1S3HLN7_LINAN|nr:oxidoreductase-like domain-containing protein 1 [Lingula anatina]|eukprot:XP_013387018.1 oxidoreductase-like domain-containing protein 1 [Lingula anatina]
MSLRHVGARCSVSFCQNILKQKLLVSGGGSIKTLTVQSRAPGKVKDENMGSQQKLNSNASVDAMPGKGPPPEPPIYCCMEGCPDCVYLKYANDLIAYYENGGEKAKMEIEKNVQNPHIQTRVLSQSGLI